MESKPMKLTEFDQLLPFAVSLNKIVEFIEGAWTWKMNTVLYNIYTKVIL